MGIYYFYNTNMISTGETHMETTVDHRTVADTNVRPELVGTEALLMPFIQNVSSQRANMFASNIAQALVLHGCEAPRIGSGYEQMIGDYSFDTSSRKHEGQLIDVIPKFEPGVGRHRINESPSKMMFMETAKGVDYFEIDSYACPHDGFGYKLNTNPSLMFMNSDSGTYIDKETKFTESPNHKDGLNCMGVNANVAYMTLPEATMDAIVIGRSLANKCASTSIYTAKIIIEKEQLPLNLYGTQDEPQIFPDIGQQVNDDGVLIALRDKSTANFADLIEPLLATVQHSSDIITRAPVGATVIDVQVYSHPNEHKKIKDNPGIMAQPVKYQEQHYNTYDRIVKLYYKCVKEGMKITPHFNDLVTRSMALNKKRKADKVINLVDKRKAVKYYVVEITYEHTRKVGNGFKFAGRSGDKGVLSTIWEDENMPVDQHGIRADMIISPESVANRLNPSQNYEQFYNRMGKLISDRYRRGELGDTTQAFNYISGFLCDVREEYGRQILEYCNTKERKEEFLDDVQDDGLYYIFPPFCKDANIDRVAMIAKKYKYEESCVTYTYKTPSEGMKTVTTKQPICIGSKYCYLLCKIPQMQASALEATYINQFGIPTKTKSKEIKSQHLYGVTPLRIGEDEVNIMLMSMEPEVVVRALGLRANCVQATNMIMEELLTAKKPSCISKINMSTKAITKNNVIAKLLTHFLGVCGIDVSENSIGRR